MARVPLGAMPSGSASRTTRKRLAAAAHPWGPPNKTPCPLGLLVKWNSLPLLMSRDLLCSSVLLGP
jgi:hypothetical protein